jgi:hypothetical protein
VLRVARDGERVAGHWLFGCFWLACFIPYLFVELGSTSTDIINTILGLVVGFYLFRLLFHGSSLSDPGFQAAVIVILAAAGITNKLSFAFLGVPAAFVSVGWTAWIALGAGTRTRARQLLPFLRGAAITAVAVLVLVVPWAARGVITSGYLAFPISTRLGLDVDWKVPEALASLEHKNILVSARTPHVNIPRTHEAYDAVLASFDWFPGWIARTALRADIFTVPMLLFLVALGACMVSWHRRRHPLDWKTGVLFLGPAGIAFVLWFLTAPAERFGGGVFWWLGAGMVAVLFERTRSGSLRRRLARWSLGFAAATGALCVVVSASLSGSRYGWALWVPPGPEAGFHPVPHVVVTSATTISGLIVNRPTSVRYPSSKWEPGPFCWDAPLPCTYNPDPYLELRVPGQLASGFRVSDPAGSPGS